MVVKVISAQREALVILLSSDFFLADLLGEGAI
jgi:hypothetical protein